MMLSLFPKLWLCFVSAPWVHGELPRKRKLQKTCTMGGGLVVLTKILIDQNHHSSVLGGGPQTAINSIKHHFELKCNALL